MTLNGEKKNPLLSLVEYWPILAFIFFAIVVYAQFGTRISAQEDRTEKVETRQDVADAAYLEVKTSLTKIETTLEFIKQQLIKIK